MVADSFLSQKNHSLWHFGFSRARLLTLTILVSGLFSHIAKKPILNQHLSGPPELLVSKRISDGTVGMSVRSFPCPPRLAFAALGHNIHLITLFQSHAQVPLPFLKQMRMIDFHIEKSS